MVVASFATVVHRLRLALLFGKFSAWLPLRSSPWCALRLPHALRSPASDTLSCFRVVLPLQTLSLLTGPVDSSRCALKRPSFGFRQVCRGLVCIGIPRA
nr:putative integron gene cassette protein [uncultured bacterium]